MANSPLDESQIRETAYLFWLDDGQPDGRDHEHWRKAIDALTPPHPKAKKPVKPRVKAAKATKTTAKSAAKPAAKRPRAKKAAAKA